MIYKVSDKDPTPPAESYDHTRSCEEVGEETGDQCTWYVDDHPDQHVVGDGDGDGDTIYEVWPVTDPTQITRKSVVEEFDDFELHITEA